MTNAYAAKKATIDRLSSAPSLADVQVAHTYPGKNPERELIYGGRVTFESQRIGLGGLSGPQRAETVKVTLHVEVVKPGATPEELEERAAEIGGLLEDALLSFELPGVPGLMQAIPTAGALNSGPVDDETSVAQLDYEITFSSHLT